MAKKTTFNTIFGEPQAPKKKKQTEGQLQMAVCNYIRTQYPNVLFISDLSSGMKLPIHVAARNTHLRSNRGMPDLMILESRNGFFGLMLELKAEGKSPFLKDGVTLSSNEHIREQAAILQKLREQLYIAAFAVGFEQARQIIDNYLK
jgi:hypothetical protein